MLDIVRACQLIETFIADCDEESFARDLRTQSAVMHQLLVVGEAVKRLSEGFRDANGDVPWRLIAGMRDRIIHGYDDVDTREVWHTARISVPELLAALAPLTPRR